MSQAAMWQWPSPARLMRKDFEITGGVSQDASLRQMVRLCSAAGNDQAGASEKKETLLEVLHFIGELSD